MAGQVAYLGQTQGMQSDQNVNLAVGAVGTVQMKNFLRLPRKSEMTEPGNSESEDREQRGGRVSKANTKSLKAQIPPQFIGSDAAGGRRLPEAACRGSRRPEQNRDWYGGHRRGCDSGRWVEKWMRQVRLDRQIGCRGRGAAAGMRRMWGVRCSWNL